MKILLSIRPEFVEKIFEGSKRYEYRKRPFKDPSVKTVVIYSTKPVGKIVGEFQIKQVLQGSPRQVWELTRKGAGISYSFFRTYFKGRAYAVALEIGELKKYDEPIQPSDLFANFTPPQSYIYLTDSSY